MEKAALSLMLSLLDKLEERQLLTQEDGRSVVEQAAILSEKLEKMPWPDHRPYAQKWLQELYQEAKNDAERRVLTIS